MYTQAEISTVFDRAIALVQQGWTQFADARDDQGQPCDPTEESAVAFSIPGAFDQAAINLGYYELFYVGNEPCKVMDRTLWKLIERTLQPIVGNNIEYYNDQYAIYQHEILHVLRRGRQNIPSLGLLADDDSGRTPGGTHESQE